MHGAYHEPLSTRCVTRVAVLPAPGGILHPLDTVWASYSAALRWCQRRGSGRKGTSPFYVMDERGMQSSLETQRLRLVPLAANHADALYRVYAEPAVAEFLFTRPRSSDEFAPIFERALQFGESHGMWAIVSRDDETLIGRVGFYAFGEAERPELAFLLSRSAWGRGLATEACARALEHTLQSHSRREVVALVRPSNTAAVRVVEKLGFSPESNLCVNGEPARLYQTSRGPAEYDPSVGAVGR